MVRYLGLLLAFALASCGGDRTPSKKSSGAAADSKPAAVELEYEVSWVEEPFVGVQKKRSNHFKIRFQEKQNPSVQPEIKNFDFWPFMKIHGHGAAGNLVIKQLSNNEFDLSGFIFTMTGPWELEFRYSYLGISHALSIPISL